MNNYKKEKIFSHIMKVFIERDNKNIDYDISDKNNPTCKDILKDFEISLESSIIVKNGNVCLESEPINNDDELKILSVVSGG